MIKHSCFDLETFWFPANFGARGRSYRRESDGHCFNIPYRVHVRDGGTRIHPIAGDRARIPTKPSLITAHTIQYKTKPTRNIAEIVVQLL